MKCFWFLFHDWRCSGKHPDNMQSKEAWYWHIDVCVKCKSMRAVLGVCPIEQKQLTKKQEEKYFAERR